MKNIYKKMYGEGKNVLELENNPRIAVMSRIINGLDLDNKNILDIGCYDGHFLGLIKNKNNNFYGIETSEFGVKKCAEKGIKISQFFFDDKTPFPFSDNFFDVIVAGEIIEHIYDTDFFLEEIKRLLKPNGFFLISTPNIASLGRRLFLLAGKNPLIEISPNKSDSSGHIRYFTFKTLKNLLRDHGLEVTMQKSDAVNFSSSGKIRSKNIAGIFPTIGQSIIFLCKKTK